MLLGATLSLLKGRKVDAEQEFRRHEHRLDSRLDAALEVARLAVRAAPLVERIERLDVGARHRTPERSPREPRENGSRAGRLLSGSCGRPVDTPGPTDENLPPARCVAAPGRLVWTADDQLADFRRRRRHVE